MDGSSRIARLIGYDVGMSSAPVIVCQKCRSFRVRQKGEPGGRRFRVQYNEGSYLCHVCGCEFEVADAKAYARQNLPDIHRCPECDQVAVELIERDHRYPDQSPAEAEIADLYRCSLCGLEIRRLVQMDPGSLY